MIKFKQILSKFRIHKRLTVILSVIFLLLLIIIGGFFWSQKAWSDYDTNYNKYFDDAKTDIKNSFSQISAESKGSLSEKLDFIIQTQTKLKNNIDTYCKINPIIKWQSFISQYHEKLDNCEYQKDNLNQFLLKLSITTDYLRIEQQLANIISVANGKTNQNNQTDKWELIEPFWRQAIVDISNLSNIEQFNTVKIVATEKITNIADAWQQLSIANKAEDMQKFGDANSNLVKTYTSIAEISNISKLQTEKLFIDLNNSSEKLF